MMKKITTTLTFAIFSIALLGAVLLLGAMIPLFNYDLRIVQSGSMEPTVPTGSVIIIYSANSYTIGDVITFQRSGEKEVTTHRIIEERLEMGEEVFVTQGDANNVADSEPVLPIEITGKMWAHVPFVGYILDFFRQPIGFLILVVIPMVLLCVEQVGKIKTELRRQKAKEEDASKV